MFLYWLHKTSKKKVCSYKVLGQVRRNITRFCYILLSMEKLIFQQTNYHHEEHPTTCSHNIRRSSLQPLNTLKPIFTNIQQTIEVWNAQVRKLVYNSHKLKLMSCIPYSRYWYFRLFLTFLYSYILLGYIFNCISSAMIVSICIHCVELYFENVLFAG